MLHLPAGPTLAFGKLALVFGDEVALKTIIGCKGAGGFKPCVLCSNIADHKSPKLPDPTGYLVPSNSLDVNKFSLNTNEKARAILHRLREASSDASMTKIAWENLQRDLGFTYSEFSPILADDIAYQPISTLGSDWMHAFFASGVFAVEVGMLFASLSRHTGLGYSQLSDYLMLWTFPKGYVAPTYILSQQMIASSSEAKRLKGLASEMLGLTPVLRMWLTNVVLKLEDKVQHHGWSSIVIGPRVSSVHAWSSIIGVSEFHECSEFNAFHRIACHQMFRCANHMRRVAFFCATWCRHC